MDDETRVRRGLSFSAVADAYERARPGYPADAVARLAGEPPRDVLDLGAGTGKLTRQLVAVGHRVVAVEPLPEMLEQLRAALPGADAREGSAEAIPLPNESVDVVTAAQAFHWFDHPVALAEIARVLRPGGELGLIWNMRVEDGDWTRRLSELLGSEKSDDDFPRAQIDGSGLFGPVEHETFRHEQTLDRMALRDFVLSRSACATLRPEEREDVLRQVDELYDEAEAGSDGIVLPYETEVFRAVRR
jgi:SAM-dependent methyltransferase